MQAKLTVESVQYRTGAERLLFVFNTGMSRKHRYFINSSILNDYLLQNVLSIFLSIVVDILSPILSFILYILSYKQH